MEVRDALALANERELDLVEIAPTATPPTCKLMDYGKYKYQQKKKNHGQKKTSHRQKEIKLRPKTDDHDIEVKVNRAKAFLDKGHKVQVTMVFRGREAIHVDLGRQILNRFQKELDECAKLEKPPTKEGRNRMSMILAKR
jgi:translation initiation factor IF-3